MIAEIKKKRFQVLQLKLFFANTNSDCWMTWIIYTFFAAGFSRTWCYNIGLPGGWPRGSWCTPTPSSTTQGWTSSTSTSTSTASTLPGRRAASSSSPTGYGWWSPAASASHDARRSAHAPGFPRHRLSVQPAGWGAAARDEGEEEVQPSDPAETGQLDQGKRPIQTERRPFRLQNVFNNEIHSHCGQTIYILLKLFRFRAMQRSIHTAFAFFFDLCCPILENANFKDEHHHLLP